MQSVELKSSNLEHSEQSCWSSKWVEEAKTLAVVQSFLRMLEREHQCVVIQDTSLRQSAQLCLSSTDSQETEMPLAKYLAIDVCLL